MKEWKDGKNRYELRLDGQEAFVLYYDNEYGYSSMVVRLLAHIADVDAGGEGDMIGEELPEEKKQAAEKWYAERLRKSIETHKLSISIREKLLEQMEG